MIFHDVGSGVGVGVAVGDGVGFGCCRCALPEHVSASIVSNNIARISATFRTVRVLVVMSIIFYLSQETRNGSG